MPETLRADAVFGPTARRARTPNMDSLAAAGTSFTSCFAQNPICSPSRCSMFTGFYPHTWGHRSLLSLIKPNQRNLFSDLKEAGYRNVAFGKNDLMAAESIPLCFDEVGSRVKPDALKRNFEPAPHPDNSRWKNTFYQGKRTRTDCQDGDWVSIQSALQFLDEKHDRPFCLYLPLSFVHPSYRVEEPFFSLHPLDSIPDPIPAEHKDKRGYMATLHKVHGVDRLSVDDRREIKRVYFGMTSRIDHQLGLLIAKLKERGLLDNTVIVMFTDHGDYTGDYGMVEKFVAGFEDCLLRVPLIVSGPGVSAGLSSAGLCEMTDLYPTLLELAGLKPPYRQFGRSLCPILRGQETSSREAVFAEGGYLREESVHFNVEIPDNSSYKPMADAIRAGNLPARAVMVRTDRWKYVYSPTERDELFDLDSDPHELVNLAGAPEHAGTVAHLRERLLRWMVLTGDVLPPERDPRGWTKKIETPGPQAHS